MIGDNIDSGGDVVDLAVFSMRKKSLMRREEALDAAKFLNLPNANEYVIYKKVKALKKLMHYASRVSVIPGEGITDGRWVIECLIKCCTIFSYSLAVDGDKTLVFSFSDCPYGEFYVHFEKSLLGSDELFDLVSDLVVEAGSRGHYVSSGLVDSVIGGK